MQSRVAWFLIARICLHNKYRGGLWEYRLFTQFMERVPVPRANSSNRNILSNLGTQIAAFAQSRYALHNQVRGRIQSDLGAPGLTLNQKLTAWWELPHLAAFRAELKKALKVDVPLRERDDWEHYLRAQQAEHTRLTAEIVRLETELNAHVYRLFDLTPDEIQLIEDSTKYRYGEV